MVAYSGASAGDKVTYVTSKAILKASDDLLQQLKTRVAAALEASPQDIVYERKRFWVQGSPERGMPLADVAQRTIRSGGAVMGYGSASETFSTVALAPNAAAHVVDVEVDRDTGQVKILRYTTFQDVGLCVNPDQVEGQMQGGATQGIGWALAETYLFDDRRGGPQCKSAGLSAAERTGRAVHLGQRHRGSLRRPPVRHSRRRPGADRPSGRRPRQCNLSSQRRQATGTPDDAGAPL